METFTVSFFGHRQIEEAVRIERTLEKLVTSLLHSKEYVEFLVGRNGDFDLLAASVIHRCKRSCRADNSALIWVLPYLTAELRDNEAAYRAYYDEIEIYSAVGSHYKSLFQARNKSMVDRSDLTVFCVHRNYGGAWKTMKYAEKQGSAMINLCDGDDSKYGSLLR